MMKAEGVSWELPVVLTVTAIGVGAIEFVVFPPRSGTGIEAISEGGIIPLLIGGLFLIAIWDVAHSVARFLYVGTFILLLHAITETVDELVRPPLLFTVVVEHLGLIVGIGLLFGVLWQWIQSRQERERELTATQHFLNRTEELADVGGWELDLTTDELSWTDGTRRIHNVPPDYEPTLDDALSFYHPEDRPQITSLIEKAAEEGTPFHTEHRLITADDRIRWVRIRGNAITEDDEIVSLQGAIQDITPEKERTQQLTVLDRLLRHNLRNDLNIIMGYAETLPRVFDQSHSQKETGATTTDATADPSVDRETAEQIADHAEAIIDKSKELISISNKIRKYNRLTARTESVESTELQPLLESICANKTDSYPDATIQIECPSTLKVMSIPMYLQVSFEELIENCIVHSDTDEPNVEITATPPEEGKIDIHIRDHGPGLPAQERSILEAEDETALEHGSGIGLWIINWLITRQGGTISITDPDAAGTRITISLPSASETSVTELPGFQSSESKDEPAPESLTTD